MNTSTLIFLDEQAPMESKEIKKHISKDTDVPTLLRVLAKTNIERSIKVLLELLEHKDQVRVALFAAKSVAHLDTMHKGTKCLALVEQWLKGEKVTKKQFEKAAEAARAAVRAAVRAAGSAAGSADWAVRAAYWAASAADADAASWAARAAANAAAKYQEILEYGIGLLE